MTASGSSTRRGIRPLVSEVTMKVWLPTHVDLQDAMDHKITVAEVTYSNFISVSEHVVRHCHVGPAKALLGNFSPTAQSSGH
jgi:hypothetical protein